MKTINGAKKEEEEKTTRGEFGRGREGRRIWAGLASCNKRGQVGLINKANELD